MLRKFIVSLLLIISCFATITPIHAVTHDLTFVTATTHYIALKGSVDNPTVNISIIDIKTKQVIGNSIAKASQKGEFETTVYFKYPLSIYNELLVQITDSDYSGIKTFTEYSAILGCAPGQTPATILPCDLKSSYKRPGGDTMGP